MAWVPDSGLPVSGRYVALGWVESGYFEGLDGDAGVTASFAADTPVSAGFVAENAATKTWIPQAPEVSTWH